MAKQGPVTSFLARKSASSCNSQKCLELEEQSKEAIFFDILSPFSPFVLHFLRQNQNLMSLLSKTGLIAYINFGWLKYIIIYCK